MFSGMTACIEVGRPCCWSPSPDLLLLVLTFFESPVEWDEESGAVVPEPVKALAEDDFVITFLKSGLSLGIVTVPLKVRVPMLRLNGSAEELDEEVCPSTEWCLLLEFENWNAFLNERIEGRVEVEAEELRCGIPLLWLFELPSREKRDWLAV